MIAILLRRAQDKLPGHEAGDDLDVAVRTLEAGLDLSFLGAGTCRDQHEFPAVPGDDGALRYDYRVQALIRANVEVGGHAGTDPSVVRIELDGGFVGGHALDDRFGRIDADHLAGE